MKLTKEEIEEVKSQLRDYKERRDLIKEQLMRIFVQGWYDGVEGKNDSRKIEVAEEYLKIIENL